MNQEKPQDLPGGEISQEPRPQAIKPRDLFIYSVLLVFAGVIIGTMYGEYIQAQATGEKLNNMANSELHLIRHDQDYYLIYPFDALGYALNTENNTLPGIITIKGTQPTKAGSWVCGNGSQPANLNECVFIPESENDDLNNKISSCLRGR